MAMEESDSSVEIIETSFHPYQSDDDCGSESEEEKKTKLENLILPNNWPDLSNDWSKNLVRIGIIVDYVDKPHQYVRFLQGKIVGMVPIDFKNVPSDPAFFIIYVMVDSFFLRFRPLPIFKYLSLEDKRIIGSMIYQKTSLTFFRWSTQHH